VAKKAVLLMMAEGTSARGDGIDGVVAPGPAGPEATVRRTSAWRLLGLGLLLAAAGTGLYIVLAPVSEWLTYSLLGLPRGTHVGSAVEFFLFEVPKVLLLLTAVVFVVGIIRSFFTPQRTRAMLKGRRESVGNVLAAFLGVVTPFCSCSAVPLFIGFVTAGVPLGVTFSFLVAAPMINEIALGLLLSMFGWQVAGLYLGTGLLVAILSGWIIGRLKMEKYVEEWVYQTPVGPAIAAEGPTTWADRLVAGWQAVKDIVRRVWLFVILGIAVGAGIHGYVPEDYLASIMGKDAWWSVPLAVILGVPMYSNAAGIIPVVQALLGKGAALGTVLAFMMSVIGLSLPEAVILRKVLKMRLIITFFGVVALGILIVGYLFNLLL
jgi:uncharacterized protein